MIPLCKPEMGLEEAEAVLSVLRSGNLAHGKVVSDFENSFADLIGCKYALALNSCTSALQLALMASDIKGDVLVPSFTFSATANAVFNAGCKPIFVEIGDDKCIDPDLLERYLTIDTKALIVVHFAGQVADMIKIKAFCEEYEILLIEDCAQCIDGYQEVGDKKIKAGNFGIGCFSFFPTKQITTGEGGMLTTNDYLVYKRAKLLSAHGVFKDRHYRNSVFPGFNYRMSSIHAAIGVAQLKKINCFNSKRFNLALLYDEILQDKFGVPLRYKDRTHGYQMYNVVLGDDVDRDEVIKKMNSKGIEVSAHFDPPVHKQYAYLINGSFSQCSLPKTEKLASKIITLPIFPNMTVSQVEFVCEQLCNSCFT